MNIKTVWDNLIIGSIYFLISSSFEVIIRRRHQTNLCAFPRLKNMVSIRILNIGKGFFVGWSASGYHGYHQQIWDIRNGMSGFWQYFVGALYGRYLQFGFLSRGIYPPVSSNMALAGSHGPS